MIENHINRHKFITKKLETFTLPHFQSLDVMNKLILSIRLTTFLTLERSKDYHISQSSTFTSFYDIVSV